jgi:phosphoribosylanthranilate isomerase
MREKPHVDAEEGGAGRGMMSGRGDTPSRITHHASRISQRTCVKICGITCREDAKAAVAAGADALGFNFAESPRRVTPEEAAEIVGGLPPFVTTVGVVVDQDVEAIRRVCPLDMIQFHGAEAPEVLRATNGVRRVKAFRIRDGEDLRALDTYLGVTKAFLLDAYVPGIAGGTGQCFNWELARRAKSLGVPIILAGGLSPENVGDAIRAARPYAVDVSSGVEACPGRKDLAKMMAFLTAVRSVDSWEECKRRRCGD